MVSVDDVLITSPNENLIAEVKIYLHKKFTIKVLGDASYFLGIELLKTIQGLYVNQRKYVFDILSQMGLKGVKLASNPIIKNLQLCMDERKILEDPKKIPKVGWKITLSQFYKTLY